MRDLPISTRRVICTLYIRYRIQREAYARAKKNERGEIVLDHLFFTKDTIWNSLQAAIASVYEPTHYSGDTKTFIRFLTNKSNLANRS